MMTHFLRSAFSFLILIGLIAACGAPLQTTRSVFKSQKCDSGDGGYHLPKRILQAAVVQAPGGSPTRFNLDLDTETPKHVADESQTFCLDFKGSFISEDRIAYKIDANGLLDRIYSQNLDKTAEISTAAIKGLTDFEKAQAIRAQIAGPNLNKTADSDARPILADVEFDPFDRNDMRIANQALAPYGYCIYLDPSSDRLVPRDFAALCPFEQSSSNQGAGASGKLSGQADPRVELVERTQYTPPDEAVGGILYRPNISHDLVVLRQVDPGGSQWVLSRIEPVSMPNRAPTLVAKINRSTFVKREVEMSFEQGVLVDVALNKQSELNAALNIPIAIANAIFALPGQILQLQTSDANNKKALIEANNALLKQLETYQESLDKVAVAKDDATDGSISGNIYASEAFKSFDEKKSSSSLDENRAAVQCGEITETETERSNCVLPYAKCIVYVSDKAFSGDKVRRCSDDYVEFIKNG